MRKLPRCTRNISSSFGVIVPLERAAELHELHHLPVQLPDDLRDQCSLNRANFSSRLTTAGYEPRATRSRLSDGWPCRPPSDNARPLPNGSGVSCHILAGADRLCNVGRVRAEPPGCSGAAPCRILSGKSSLHHQGQACQRVSFVSLPRSRRAALTAALLSPRSPFPCRAAAGTALGERLRPRRALPRAGDLSARLRRARRAGMAVRRPLLVHE